MDGGGVGVALALPYSPPYDWQAMTGFLGPRAIPGVEWVEPGLYRRTFVAGRSHGVLEVRPDERGHRLVARVWMGEAGDPGAVAARLRRLFDLDADAAAIDAHLAKDPVFARRVHERPGVRVPGAWDGFELAVRAVLGQQITVAAATTFAGRVAARFGAPLDGGFAAAGSVRLVFPPPAALAAADLTAIGLTRARAATLQTLARTMTEAPHLLQPCDTLDATIRKLCALPGIGAWTAHYIAMREQREPDAFPASDLGLLRALAGPGGRPTAAQLLARAERWRPWRAYAAMRLWLQPAG